MFGLDNEQKCPNVLALLMGQRASMGEKKSVVPDELYKVTHGWTEDRPVCFQHRGMYCMSRGYVNVMDLHVYTAK